MFFFKIYRDVYRKIKKKSSRFVKQKIPYRLVPGWSKTQNVFVLKPLKTRFLKKSKGHLLIFSKKFNFRKSIKPVKKGIPTLKLNMKKYRGIINLLIY